MVFCSAIIQKLVITKYPMAEFLFNPDFLFILLSICGSMSLLVTSLITFRFLAIIISVGYLFVILWVGLDKVGMIAQLGTSLLGISLNGVMIGQYFYARSMASLSYTWRSMYVENFSLMLPYEFNELVKYGQINNIRSQEQSEFKIQEQNQNFQSLFYILEGTATVDVDGDKVATLYAGEWIAEETFLTHEKAKDDIWVNNATLIKWNETELNRLKKNRPEVYEKLNLIISRNLCHKLIRAYSDEHLLIQNRSTDA